MLDQLRERGFNILALHHAEAILLHDMPEALEDIERTLLDIRVPVEELVRGGGGEGGLTQRLRRALHALGWEKRNFVIRKIVDDRETESTSHEVDHVKRFARGTIALEIEWNNKDPFFDRDLENFKRLHAEGVISLGAIITRGASLHERMREIIADFARERGMTSLDDVAAFYAPTARQRKLVESAVARHGSFAKGWAHAFVADKFGEATTHWRKLEDRVRRGVGNPCPLLLIGIPNTVVEECGA